MTAIDAKYKYVVKGEIKVDLPNDSNTDTYYVKLL